MRERRTAVLPDPPRKSAAKRRELVAEMRAKGYKRKMIWVVDTSRPGFAEDAKRQCLAVRDDPREQEALDWIEKAMDYSG